MRRWIEELALGCVVAEPNGSLERLRALEKIRGHGPDRQEAMCVVFGMPRETTEWGVSEQVLPPLSVPEASRTARMLAGEPMRT